MKNIAVTSDVKYHLIREVISNDAGHTKSYRQLRDHSISSYHPPLHDCYLDTNLTRNIRFVPKKRQKPSRYGKKELVFSVITKVTSKTPAVVKPERDKINLAQTTLVVFT